MPWWVWLLLVLFMTAVLIAGVAYVCVHGYRAFKVAVALGGRISKRCEDMSKTSVRPQDDMTPFFARPLKDATDRYTDAQVDVIRHHELKRTRHARQWARWKNFND